MAVLTIDRDITGVHKFRAAGNPYSTAVQPSITSLKIVYGVHTVWGQESAWREVTTIMVIHNSVPIQVVRWSYGSTVVILLNKETLVLLVMHNCLYKNEWNKPHRHKCTNWMDHFICNYISMKFSTTHGITITFVWVKIDCPSSKAAWVPNHTSLVLLQSMQVVLNWIPVTNHYLRMVSPCIFELLQNNFDLLLMLTEGGSQLG